MSKFGKDFIDWNRNAIGMDPSYDRDAEVPFLEKMSIGKSCSDRLDVLAEIYRTLSNRYSLVRSI